MEMTIRNFIGAIAAGLVAASLIMYFTKLELEFMACNIMLFG
jgi:hypothetical protein